MINSGSNVLAEKIDDLATRVNSLEELFQRNQDSLQDSLQQQKALTRSLQEILKQNGQYVLLGGADTLNILLLLDFDARNDPIS